ncbi:hypothetical protein DIU31_027680 [Mucilaginibacter rubeus]|uniref:Uncharacterized protein n=1 Tax=Mucilaginibacter rubeus TaxID=2027860 RepID=A0AAE6MLE4_9SPHI|nr:hypothetical protein [Mucilaginibacter rubeus]HEK21525.1 hypothetical protein [Bacteroidota bacterium]QEM07102.1 hypothetical protein DIU31_027680 [Mucilaginibacter rubeus]QTE43755.1 hypothetical protein J3L19_33385 [Mucilaginibacter rubeus]QTE50354.1 hypothetical protein J3L21_33340 [Mucilaginibacter rubeus]QTE55441.1 hypothetical protein J3L23_24955 [Mucilaginibacter rubeus]
MGFIKTIGKDGKPYYFRYELENQPCRGVSKVCFKTRFINQKDNNWFDFKVAPFEKRYIKVTDMFDTPDHSTQQLLFQGKGLPEALILEAQRVYPDKIIISDSGEALWPAGRAVWQRLVDRKLAKYEAGLDRFILNR